MSTKAKNTAVLPTRYNREVKYVVLPVDAVRAQNIRTDDEVVAAQAMVTDDMLRALEDMINTARAGTLETRAALSQAAVAW